ncbi:MAG TPA: diacylglycerol kinase family protein [Candidatus Krumholzibacteria bacterium]|nr:diacylglycerol kinase family protein [Candidatus Krumholzibacteria bacterium]HPD71030.1 diacylglycerol kinase family protein [Candidatus Krumholzibacteria bacterium]HRY39270.1 diacylglycerol kinase family protein [Candidatus Krumholzibacteria bacterium]
MPEFTSALVIVNPASGPGFAPRYARRVVGDLERRGLRVTRRDSRGPDDIIAWSRAAADEGFDLICVLGGDGSLQEAVVGQVQSPRKVPLAHIASGTANVVPLTLALPWFPGPAVSAVFQGTVREFDVGYLASRQRYFILMAAIGYPANIIKDSPRRLKNFFGLGTYVWAAVSNLFRRQSAFVTVESNGVKHRRKANTVLLTNIGLVPDINLRVTPDTDPQDGRLDVTIISSRSLWDVAVIIFRMLTWRSPKVARMKHFKAERVTIESDPPLPVQIDGEMAGTTPLAAEILPRAVRLVVGPRYRAKAAAASGR